MYTLLPHSVLKIMSIYLHLPWCALQGLYNKVLGALFTIGIGGGNLGPQKLFIPLAGIRRISV